MKQILLIFSLALLAIGCTNTAKTNNANVDKSQLSASAAKFQFDQTTYDFGIIDQGDTVVHNYSFNNAGKSPLIITDAQASCGCTIPEFPHEPIAPGKIGVIKVIFNSANKFGKQTKAITITANTVPAITQLLLTGEVRDNKQINSK
ncbi:DUF1573 domain-containing protein [Pedobacter sp. HMF7647]|uniref:DUF1573 domain-containing protein n=1 Tax=Hufsiella arboris TaxID=2695275 RepID=A0A7K1YD34_9SPHI|nr:DUF1573 domain-containing protein [Hufsiella arboris]MXV52497.1 DUF1573 domain-containing protein [Hufsiella arboris]